MKENSNFCGEIPNFIAIKFFNILEISKQHKVIKNNLL